MSHKANDHYQETVKEARDEWGTPYPSFEGSEKWDEVAASRHADDEQAEKDEKFENLTNLRD